MPSNNSQLFSGLFGRTREAVIGLLFSTPGVELHGRDIAKRAAVSAAAVSDELKQLSQLGFVTSRPLGNLLLYRANDRHSLYPELCSIAVKTWGLAGRLREVFATVPDMPCAFVFGSIARGDSHAASDIDVLAIGETRFDHLALLAEASGRDLGRPINIKLYRPDEWHRKANSENAFFTDVLKGPKIFLRGDEEMLDGYTESGKPRPAGALGEAGARPRGNSQSHRDSEGTTRHRASTRRP